MLLATGSMTMKSPTGISHIKRMWAQCKAHAPRWVRKLMAARLKLRRHERRFYRSYAAYCREHGLEPRSEDNWWGWD
jgi:hypothetical protein